MTTAARPNLAGSAARLLTGIFAPAHLVTGLLLLIGATSHRTLAVGLAWGTLAAIVIGVVPYAWVLYAVRRGRFTSGHIPERAQRLLPLAVAGAAVVAGFAILSILGAPRTPVALVLAMLTGLAITAGITTRWKISLHTAVAAGTAAILTVAFGPAGRLGVRVPSPAQNPRSQAYYRSVNAARPSFCPSGSGFPAPFGK